jgi:hypothetical protein
LPGGRPVFPQVPVLTPDHVLEQSGMSPGEARVLDEAANVTVVTWNR